MTDITQTELATSIKRLLTNPLSMNEIKARLAGEKGLRPNKVRKTVRAMADAGIIVRIKGARYGLPGKMNLVTGVIQGHRDGYGFVIPDDPDQADVFLGRRNFDIAMHADRVVCRVESTRPDGRREGSVIRVLDRARETVVGKYESYRGGGYVTAFDTRIIHDLYIPPDSSMNAKTGHAVIAEITEYPSKTRQAQGRVTKILGPSDDPKVEIKIVTESFSLRSQFPSSVLAEAAKFTAPQVGQTYKSRLDLRHKPTVTIDGESAKDFDDAVEVEKLTGGRWKLGVHIADVSHYVKENSAIDKEALKRAVSVYFPGSVVPMLPFELSNDICSLNPKVDRLTMSCIMTFDGAGDLERYEICESVIRSVERMTYGAVADILEKRNPSVMERYGGLAPMFEEMKQLAEVLNAKRGENGAIDFDLPEPEVILDITGRPENIIRAERNVAHKIIEEFMLVANKTVAEHMIKRKHTAIYRVHDDPDPLKVDSFKEFIRAFGYDLKKDETLDAMKMRKILEWVAGGPEENLVTRVLLRSMKQARYSTDTNGHFALAFDHYAHFTSPIRRYPDLVTHRILKDIIHRANRKEYWEEAGPPIAMHCSKAERVAEDAERDIIKRMQTRYMAGRVEEEFDGIISGVTAFGFFVELNEPAVEGLVRLTSIPDDYYVYQEATHALVGERTNKRFRLGDRTRIKVVGVSLARNQVDFEWVGPTGKRAKGKPPGRLPKSNVRPKNTRGKKSSGTRKKRSSKHQR